MNQKAQKLKMTKTHFCNPHGLDQAKHYSCCDDMLVISKVAMKMEMVRKVVMTPSYKGILKYYREGKTIYKPAYWRNTQKLLGKMGVIGIKTGVTPKAGGCLSTCFKNNEGEECIIIVLGCASTEQRFTDSEMIMRWG